VSVRWFHRDRGYHVVALELRAAKTPALIAELSKLPEIQTATFHSSPEGPVTVTF
jgi:hypothetical protein